MLEAVKAEEKMEEQNCKRICNQNMDINMRNRVRFQRNIANYCNERTLTQDDLKVLITKTKVPTNTTNGMNIREVALQCILMTSL
jgi:hypothetical protein